MKYSWKRGLKKAIIYTIIFLLPVLVDQFIIKFPDIAQTTIGGLLVMLVNFIKIKVTKTNKSNNVLNDL